jgi:hypothetical protein
MARRQTRKALSTAGQVARVAGKAALVTGLAAAAQATAREVARRRR